MQGRWGLGAKEEKNRSRVGMSGDREINRNSGQSATQTASTFIFELTTIMGEPVPPSIHAVSPQNSSASR